MGTNVRELNGYWLDHLHSLKRLEKFAKEKGFDEMVEAIKEEESYVTDKLYQDPAMTKDIV